MNKKLSFKIAIVCFVIVALACPGLVFAADEIKVIGKAAIKKGAVLEIIVMVSPTKPMVGTVVAFEDQVLYVMDKIEPDAGSHRGGYMLDGQGFVHDCRTHGREVMGLSIIVLPIEVIEAGKATVKLF